MQAKEAIERLATVVGFSLNGDKPTDPQIYNERVYNIFLSRNSLALGESFMAKWWDCADLAGFFSLVLNAKLFVKKNVLSDPRLFLRTALSNLQRPSKSFEVGEMHYDLGNELYEAMLDKYMVYTSAIWSGVDNLEAAQVQKLERICQKLKLKAGDRVLDIGCGWGGFMKYATQRYGVSCVGLSVSKEQTTLGRQRCEGLPIEFVISDYRDYQNEHKFDHVVSIEMIEAVGPKNLRTYFKKVHELLKPNGNFFLQAIIDLNSTPKADPWIDKYIFRNGVLVSHHQLERETRGLFVFTDLLDVGPDYDPTLMAWWENFDRTFPNLQADNPKYDEHFYRMWKYYLHSCAALFRTGSSQDYQMLLKKV
jgi:cyclopropane-fatty-acyl-phospholipid synthase